MTSLHVICGLGLPPIRNPGYAQYSVARGGGGLEPPHWSEKYAKSHVFGAFEADFCSKYENSPLPPKGFGCRSCEGVAVSRPEEPCEFPISAEKSVSISDKPFESYLRAMKIRVKVAYSCLTLSKKPPFSKSWQRLCWLESGYRSEQ